MKYKEVNYQILSSRQWWLENSMSSMRITKNYREATRNLLQTVSMSRDMETIKCQMEMKNRISELKNTVEGIKSRLDEAED